MRLDGCGTRFQHLGPPRSIEAANVDSYYCVCSNKSEPYLVYNRFLGWMWVANAAPQCAANSRWSSPVIIGLFSVVPSRLGLTLEAWESLAYIAYLRRRSVFSCPQPTTAHVRGAPGARGDSTKVACNIQCRLDPSEGIS